MDLHSTLTYCPQSALWVLYDSQNKFTETYYSFREVGTEFYNCIYINFGLQMVNVYFVIHPLFFGGIETKN
jgi:hypothetical protein